MVKIGNREYDVRLSEKPTLTVVEAAAYTGIGIQKIMRMADEPGCEFVLYSGRKRLLKRRKLEEYLESHYSI